MTRREFDEDVNEFQQLIDICFQYGFEYCDDVYSRVDAYDMVMENLNTLANPQEALDYLLNFNMNCDWYLVSAQGLVDADPYFAELKNQVANEMTREHLWDEDEHAAAEAVVEATIDDLIMANEYVLEDGEEEELPEDMWRRYYRHAHDDILENFKRNTLRHEDQVCEDTEEVEDIDLDGFTDLIGA